MSTEESGPEQEQEAPNNDDAEQEKSANTRRLRALILGTIAAGGAFQLNGWQAQAHGNRSSGAVQSIRALLPRDQASAPADADKVDRGQIEQELPKGGSPLPRVEPEKPTTK